MQEIHVVDVNQITIYLLHVLTQWQENSNRFYITGVVWIHVVVIQWIVKAFKNCSCVSLQIVYMYSGEVVVDCVGETKNAAVTSSSMMYFWWWRKNPTMGQKICICWQKAFVRYLIYDHCQLMRLKGFGYHLATQEQLIFLGPFTLFQGWMIWGKEVLDGGHQFSCVVFF